MPRMMFAGLALACTAASIAQAADPLQLTCTGDMIEPGGLARAPKTVIAVFSAEDKITKVSLNLGEGAVSATALNNNKIQLKFHTKDFVGEYFYYDRDLFLIYKSGHLARLTCKPT